MSDPQTPTPSVWVRRLKKLLFLGLAGGVLGLATLIAVRMPRSTPETRGAELATNLGCFACHGPGGLNGAQNPEAKGNRIPPFNARGPIMSYIQSEEEIREWIMDGAPKRLWVDKRRPPRQGIAGGVIKMPAFREYVSERDANDLVAYVKAVAMLDQPADENAAEGQAIAERAGCFGCHGANGQGGFANPFSFKGYIPPWNGDDFNELVKNETELREWILTGTISRFTRDPLARFFMNRMAIRMPAYEDVLTDTELESVVSYIKWLRNPYHKSKRQWVKPEEPTTESKVARGKYLFSYVGCATCHNNEGKGEIVNANASGGTVPALNDLAEKLQLFSEKDAKVFVSLLEHGVNLQRLLDNPPFPDYQAVYETYLGTRDLMIRGGVPHERDPSGPPPPMQMPAWSERMHSDQGPFLLADLDSVIAYLVTLEQWQDVEHDAIAAQAAVRGFPFPQEADYTPKVKDYKTTFKRLTGTEFSGLHGNKSVVIYVNDGGAVFKHNHEIYKRKFEEDDDDQDNSTVDFKDYAPGTVLLAEHFDPSAQKAGENALPEFINLMIKHEPGYDSSNDDWQYVKITNKGRVIVDGSGQNYAARVVCAGCHSHVQNRDHVFATYLSEDE